LDYTVDVPRLREDILELTERRDLRFSSFSFQAYEQNWTYEDSIPTWHLESVRLIDIAPVANPAYPSGPSVGLRSLAVQFNADPDDVYRMARENELRKLFVRTGGYKFMSGRQALVSLMAMANPRPTQYKPVTPAQVRAQLTRMRYPKPARTPAQARAELTRMALRPYETAASIGLDA
jgi:hypothetical protein